MSGSAVLSYAHGFLSHIPWRVQDGDGSDGIGIDIDRNPSDPEEMLVVTQIIPPTKLLRERIGSRKATYDN